jgi:hypothetical protein
MKEHEWHLDPMRLLEASVLNLLLFVRKIMRQHIYDIKYTYTPIVHQHHRLQLDATELLPMQPITTE